nr:threonine ammonia-lyase IlvA [Nakamurella lactea]
MALPDGTAFDPTAPGVDLGGIDLAGIADRVDAAATRIAGVVNRTPLEPSPRLSAVTGHTVLLKREDQQSVRSYKIRGAYNLMAQLSEAERAAGVVCASAGNHAQGVALACRLLGIHGRIHLPATTPRQKRERIRAHGGDLVELVIAGDTFDDAAAAAAADAQRSGAIAVPPFDDQRTMAGQGTVAAEIADQLRERGLRQDALIVPVGGGGLIGGTVAWLSRHAPEVRVIGAEPAGGASMAAALAAGRPVRLDRLDPFTDGAAVRTIGNLPYAVLSTAIAHASAAGGPGAELLAIDEGAICTAMLDLYQQEGIIAEPAGALSVAALLDPSMPELPAGSVVVCLVSGGNNDVSRYGEILERSLVHLGVKHYFLVEFPQEPGALRRFLIDVLGPDDDITLFEYVKRNNRETGPALVGLELESAEGLQPLLQRLAESPMTVEQIAPGSTTFRYLT